MPDIDLTAISPVTDDHAARLVSPAAFADLSSQISMTALPGGRQAAAPGWARRRSPRRALLFGLPVASLAGAAALLVAVAGQGNGGAAPGAGNGGTSSQAAIQALSFTRENGVIKVVVRNPLADASWYNADFARHHLDIKLSLVPVSPSLVGTVVFTGTDSNAAGSEITTITAKGRCFTGGGGDQCPVGLEIPADFHGKASITFGRAARHGEEYESTTSAFAPGEALAGLRNQVIGQPVSKVWALLAAHHLTVGECRDASNAAVDPAKVPGNYYVTNVLPWAPGEVIVWTGPTPSSGSGANSAAPRSAGTGS